MATQPPEPPVTPEPPASPTPPPAEAPAPGGDVDIPAPGAPSPGTV
ncbi:hypothetical protein ABDK56_02520 [Sphingomonas sp. ASV193]